MRASAFDNFYKDQLNECLQSTGSVWEEAVKYKSPEAAQKMAKLFEDIIDLQQDFDCYMAARGGYTEGDDYDNILQQAKQFKDQNSYSYQRSKQQLIEQQKEKIRACDDDIVIEESASTVGLLCPITNKIPTNPVVSRKCHHVYEKTAIIAYIQSRSMGRNMSAPCPFAGCNRQLSIDDLVEDPEVNRRCDEARDQAHKDDEYEAIK
ncbi:MGC53049 protein, putative [Trichomonas vaginalis G3]|uniref:MGC53049 protein, putative n=1 Tax=Trichomonas vaginalis (strain ATCC PRA-98 / G3) TaxID=412133 RepID=A2D8T8_TRIV3|nr:SPL-RING NSE2 domain-containing protein [Trichomonas vaginalis G3]EAY23337.1 MGC53049 protein, putative [Trichomonas vaginalis G3]KAI5533798.1 SPL-RING NSE2 domain-containing protein [Trichomonas vaginalis G3]|eukprot:XP_001584323.1 MGC53049 protein [Trichomonas vaginalis G3]